MIGYIYKTTNLINGKLYIGKHKATVFEPDKYKGSGKLLLRAFTKYGKENFKCELLETCETAQELNEREQFWIAYYNSQDDPRYYNISKSGDGGIGRSVDKPDSYWSDPIKREQALKKQSESLKRYFAEHPGIRAGSNNTNYGKKASTELRQKISEGIKASGCSERSSRFAGHHHSEESKKRIGDWNRGKRWINNGSIETCLYPGADLPEGFKLGRLKSEESLVREAARLAARQSNKTGNKKAVLCIELNKVFESAAQAHKELGVSVSKISSCCHHTRNTAGGYHWKFIEEN